MTGTYHYIAILAQQDLFPSEPTEERKESEARSASRVTANGHTTDSLDTVKRRLADNKAVLVDVREKKEWDAGHLKAAVLVPLSKLRKESEAKGIGRQLAETVPTDKIIYCHCRSGGRVLAATPILKSLGYDVRPLKLGYSDLLKAGFHAGP
jgi:rhodanese-related sulfurtransferase